MLVRTMFKSKIHRATVTGANVQYIGSITIDADLLAAADLVEYEKVQVVDVDNGQRLETYVIAGAPGSGEVCLNGAAAHKASKGDVIIIATYVVADPAELEGWSPKCVLLNQENQIKKIS